MVRTFKARVLVAGAAEGRALVTNEPLSLWGGLCPRTGEIIDRRHELSGSSVIGRILVFPRGRGSSTASATLMESIRNGVAPAAIINSSVDPILALGGIVSDELYQRSIPVLVLGQEDFAAIKADDHIRIATDGTVTVQPHD
jgi:predicted aconitase with swiveling domain